MLLKDKYRPSFLDETQLNLQYYKKIATIYNNPDNLLNTIIHGPKGCGKFTLLKCLINTLFKKKIVCSTKKIKIQVNSIEKEIEIVSSEYHFEIYLDKYLFNNKLYLFSLIDNITESKEINDSLTKKIIIIRNVNHAPREFINYIKSKIEKIESSCLFLLTTNNVSKIGKSLLGNFINIRLPYPEKKEIKNFINQVLVKESRVKKTNKFIKDIIDYNECNLSSIILNLELNLNNSSYKHDNHYDKGKFIQKLKEPNPENIIYFRNELYNLSSKNISVEDIVKDIVLHLIRYENLSSQQKIKIVEKYSFIQKNTSRCYKNIVMYEAILINIFQILNS